ncbi:tetratricopeptide repeat protein, partial [Streptomyces diastaticus]
PPARGRGGAAGTVPAADPVPPPGGVAPPGAPDPAAAALALPMPRVDPADPNAGFLAGLAAAAPGELAAALAPAPVDSPELRLRKLRAELEQGRVAAAEEGLRELEAYVPDDWRVVWYRGVTGLAAGDFEGAALSFDALYDAFPGEPAPKLALGLAAEVLGQADNAAEYYRLVWSRDPGFVGAAFSLARVQWAAGLRQEAVRTLESVPEASIHYTAARVAAIRARLRRRDPAEPLLADLTACAAQLEALEGLGLDAVRRERLAAEVLGTALDWVLSGSPGQTAERASGSGLRAGGTARTVLLGSQLDERGLRFGLERAYRTLARLARRGEERIELVERANRFRPRTMV